MKNKIVKYCTSLTISLIMAFIASKINRSINDISFRFLIVFILGALDAVICNLIMNE